MSKSVIKYREIDKLNQSLIKKLMISPYAYLEAKNRPESTTIAPHFLKGSLLDTMVLRPDAVEKEYYVSQAPVPSEAIQNIINYVSETALTSRKDLTIEKNVESLILEGANIYSYQTNWKDATRINKVSDLGRDYFNDLQSAKGRTVISKEIFNEVNIKALGLLNGTLKSYFTSEENIEIWTAVVIEFLYKGIDMKAELDSIKIDHSEKTITPVDLKSTGKPLGDFPNSFFNFRYDLQAAIYSVAIRQHPKIAELIAKGYTVKLFRFVVTSFSTNEDPLVYRVSNETLKLGLFGGNYKGKFYKGALEAIQEYKALVELDNWDTPSQFQKYGYIIL